MLFSVLGAVSVLDDRAAQVPIRGRKQAVLLGLLLSRANRPVAADRAIEVLWGADPPDSARDRLRWQVHVLRQSLGSTRVVHYRTGYAVRLGPGELDAEVFEDAYRHGTELYDHGALADCSAVLAEALQLWQGRPYAEIDAGLEAEVARLEELHWAALERQAEADLRLGRVGSVLSSLRPVVDEHPLREHLRAMLMLALHRDGRPAEALDLYRQGRQLLSDELGLEPGQELRRVQLLVLSGRG